MRARVLAVIAAYGLPALTRAVVGDLAREPETEILVVDNGGDYAAAGGERVMRPGSNLGWLRACNLGLEHGSREGFDHVLLLNNDTRLSPGFVAGLLAAHEASPGLIAPVYDDNSVPGQQLAGGGAAAEHVPREHERRLSVIDGTALLISRADADALGPLDARRFGRHGWGAIEDWCLTAQRKGIAVHATERAYVSHPRALTAKAVNVRYTHFAAAEMQYGLFRKWGRDWPLALPGSGHEPRRWSELASFAAWHLLAATGLAKRLQRPPSAPAQPGQEPAPDAERHVERDERK